MWEANAEEFFEVKVGAELSQLFETRLWDFVSKANLSEALIDCNGSNTTGCMEGGVETFYALSLKENGTPVEVRVSFDFSDSSKMLFE